MAANPPSPPSGINLYDPGVIDVLLERENAVNAEILRELGEPVPNEMRLRLLEMQLRIINDGLLGAQIRAQLKAAEAQQCTADSMRYWTKVAAIAMGIAALATIAYVIVAIVK